MLLFLDLPINSEFRELILGLEWIVSFFCIEFSILFFLKYRSRKSKNRLLIQTFATSHSKIFPQFKQYLTLLKIRELAWGFAFLFIGCTYTLLTLRDFYFSSDPLVMIHVLFFAAYFFLFFAFLLISYSFEIYELKQGHFIYTKIFSLLILILILVIIIDYRQGIYVLFLPIPVATAMFIQLSIILMKKAKGLKKINLPTIGVIVGAISFIVGFLLATLICMIFGIFFRLIGNIILIVSVAVCALSFYFLPSFAEYDWLDKVRDIYIIYFSGVTLYHYNFRPNLHRAYESDLTSSAIVAVINIMGGMALTGKKIETIKKDDFTLLVSYGKNILSVLYTDEDSISLREKNDSFCSEFEKMYPNLDSFFGNVSEYSDAYEIVKKIFQISN